MPRATVFMLACAMACPHAALSQELPATGGLPATGELPATGLRTCDAFLASYLVCVRQAGKAADRLAARARAIEEDLRDPATRSVHENICALGLTVARNIQAHGGCKTVPQM